jgi:hypothetical protein
MNATTDVDESAAVSADDLSSLDIREAEAVMTVLKPSGEPFLHTDGRPMTITVKSNESAAFVNLARKQQDRRLAVNARNQVPLLSGVIEKEMIELLAEVTVKWDLVIGGVLQPSEKKAYVDAYTKYGQLRKQVSDFVGSPANFTQG